MAIIDVAGLVAGYGKHDALHGVDLAVPEGSLCALLGPNGAGKSTLLRVLVGVLRPRAGRASVLGVDCTALSPRDRERIGYVAESQALPSWMRVEELERYLAPLYPTWDAQLANTLRERFELAADRRIRTLSRGERMKVALLCALAPRPRLLLMDEPFSGMDVIVKDELVRGLLETAGSEGWTVLLASHDISELELLADYVAILSAGHTRLAATMDDVQVRFKHVELALTESERRVSTPEQWLSVTRADRQLAFIIDAPDEAQLNADLAEQHPSARVHTRPASLREVFVALAGTRVERHLDGAEVAA